MKSVSIHALTKSATRKTKDAAGGYVCFNPRTHEECDPSAIVVDVLFFMFQSTHSRRVRRMHPRQMRRLYCFNPRTHEECDFSYAIQFSHLRSFNPRTHEECDEDYAKWMQGTEVSIHALTKSATHDFGRYPMDKRVSIHALTKSATIPSFGLDTLSGFQSTHSRRVRLFRPPIIYGLIRFNPRTHEECDFV